MAMIKQATYKSATTNGNKTEQGSHAQSSVTRKVPDYVKHIIQNLGLQADHLSKSYQLSVS